ncbi:MAG: hypothetical protein LBJ98_04385 [Endomicrobium sp.]|jgi:hypothetical protein|nr:hypothetical protein [Endomicrobium sp.]
MKKLVLAITLFFMFAMAGYAFDAKEEECYNECNRCENVYKMRRFWKDAETLYLLEFFRYKLRDYI